jgi:uncharacterized integral membrane protein
VEPETPSQPNAPRTRSSSALRATALGLVVILLMLLFIFQNGQRAKLNFLWFHWHTPVGLGLLLAAVLGGIIVLLVGVVRRLQVKRSVRLSNHV